MNVVKSVALLLILILGSTQGFSQARRTFWPPSRDMSSRPKPPPKRHQKTSPIPPKRLKNRATQTNPSSPRVVVRRRSSPAELTSSSGSLVSVSGFDNIDTRGSANGDKIDPKLAIKIDQLFENANQRNIQLALTDVMGGGHSRKSLHLTGDAADVAFKNPVRSMTKQEKKQLPKKWNTICLLAKKEGLKILNETGYRTEHCGSSKRNRNTTGPHLHLTVAPEKSK